MENTIFITIYTLLFTFITFMRFEWGLYLFFFLLPTYLIRFSIGPLPTTLLEIMFGIIFVVWLLKFNKHIIPKLKSLITDHWLLITGIILFLLGATISIFTAIDLCSALGIWKAFYIEPIILFLILVTSYKLQVTSNFVKNIILALILSGLATSILAIFQRFTGWMVPWFFWENGNSFRVTAWYGFPNGVGLFLSPLVLLVLYPLQQSWRKIRKGNWKLAPGHKCSLKIGNWLLFVSCILFLFTGPLAITFAKSTGGLIGVLGGFGLLALLYKKTRWWIISLGIIAMIGLFSLPQLSNIKEEVTFQDRSGQIRLSMWNETGEFLKDNIILGAGLNSYQEKIKLYHTTVNGEGIEIFHHPHNIFLTMWINLGLIGLIGFVIILISYFKNGFTNLNPYTKILLATMTVIVVTGLVDSPYIKNDLSILFWLLPALLIVQKYDNLENT